MFSLRCRVSGAMFLLASACATVQAAEKTSFAPYAPHVWGDEVYDADSDFRFLWLEVKQDAFDMSAALAEIATAFNMIGGEAPFYSQVIVNINASNLKGDGPQILLQAVPRHHNGQALNAADVLHFGKFNGVSGNAAGELIAWCDRVGWKLSEDSDEWCAAALPRFCRSPHRDGRCPIMP